MNSGNRAGRMDSKTAQSRPGIRGSLRRAPRKVKALRWEGPKRGARELVQIIGRPWSLVNTDTVRKYPALTVGKTDGARIIIRKKIAHIKASGSRQPQRGRRGVVRRPVAKRRCRGVRPATAAGVRATA